MALDAIKCSFCDKSQDAVQRVISSPKDMPRAYICNECVWVCLSILDEDWERERKAPETPPLEEPSRLPIWMVRMMVEMKTKDEDGEKS